MRREIFAVWMMVGLVACAPANPDAGEDVVADLADHRDIATCLTDIEFPDDPEVAVEFPETLSETGCFAEPAPGAAAVPVPAPELVPYQIRSPLWTDGVIKRRFLALPPGQAIGFAATGDWSFPERTVLIKEFILEAEVGDPDSRRPVETRFMVRARGDWEFFSYRWNDDGTEAFRNERAATVDFEVLDGGVSKTISFDFPSLLGCVACHAGAAGEVLGPRTAQLNRETRYTSGRRNQLLAMRDIGLFGDSSGDDMEPDALPRLVEPDDATASIEARARSYLHGNCAHCHLPGGYNSTEVDVDLRIGVNFEDARLCEQPIRHDIFSRHGTLVIEPGNPDNSNLYQRMLTSEIARMPPSGRSIIDPLGSELVRQWIESLAECP